MADDALTGAVWRKSSFSGGGGSGGGECVEVAALNDGRVALRNSKQPHDTVISFTRAEIAAFINGIKHHEFDDLT